jgi:hypothetical protein
VKQAHPLRYLTCKKVEFVQQYDLEYLYEQWRRMSGILAILKTKLATRIKYVRLTVFIIYNVNMLFNSDEC